MFSLLALAVAATPPMPMPGLPPPPGQQGMPPKQKVAPAEQIRQELRGKVVPALMGCDDLIEVAGIADQSSQFDFHILPTGKVTISGNPPSEHFGMLVWRCGLAALGSTTSVSVKNVTTLEAYGWNYTVPPNTGNGVAWVSDDPKALDRVVVIASEKATWVRCEHKDAALTSRSGPKDQTKLLALPDFKAPIADADTDSAPFWKVVRTRSGKHEVSAHRAALPAFAKTLEPFTGAKNACEPVRALGEKAGALLTSRQGALAACLKHRHNDLWLTLTLNGSGAVTKADARATSGLDDKALDCLEHVASKWSFPYRGESGATLSAHLQAAPVGE
jgi:hypothetical protein